MRHLSVFTPSNKPDLLREAYVSLQTQTDKDFDWHILLNGDAKIGDLDFIESENVFVHEASTTNGFVGALKKEVCDICTGDILLELDHDDLLLPNAIEEVKKAFKQDSNVGFVYSNAIYASNDLKPAARFGNGYGWQWRQHKVEGGFLDEIVSFPPTAVSVSRIWFAPDHLRAFKKSVYQEVGGHSKDMHILDDQDLMSRLFLKTSFHHIDKPLYIYRIFGDNTWQVNNMEIQSNVMPIYDKYAEGMMAVEMKRRGLMCVELGGAINPTPGFLTIDKKNADIVSDLDCGIHLPDNSVGVLKAIDVLEHLHDSIKIMKEAQRVLVPGGYFIIQVPSTDGRGAFQDPTHVSFWNENSFLYYTNKTWAKYIDTPVRFQASRLLTTEKDGIGVCWVKAHLISLKDGFRPPGQIDI